jgi:hypothetical protein
MDEPVADVSLDVHKDTIAVALAEADKRGEVREHTQDREHTRRREDVRRQAITWRARAWVLLRGGTLWL